MMKKYLISLPQKQIPGSNSEPTNLTNRMYYTRTFIATVIIAGVSQAVAAPISLDFTRDVRVISGSDNSRDDNNGGGDPSALIGLGNGVDNFQIYDFDFSGLAGKTVSGDATLTFAVSTNFTGTFAGSTNDTIWIRALYDDNAGWTEGTQTIVSGDNQTDNGSVSFLNRVQYNDDPGPPGGISTPWLDDGGVGVSDLLGAVTADLDSVAGVVDENRPGTIVSFTIAQATVQSWVDGGFAGIVVGATDGDVDGNSRFRTDNGNLSFTTVDPATVSISSITVSGTTATIVMKGAPGTDYYCAGSGDLTDWSTEVVPTDTSGSPFQTDGSGDLTFSVDISGFGTRYFLRVQDSDPSP